MSSENEKNHDTIHFSIGLCSLGSVLVAASDRGVCTIALGDDPRTMVDDLRRRFSKARVRSAGGSFDRLVAKVIGFVEDPHCELGVPLDVRGTVFQQRVWTALQKIPLGQTVSYATLAQTIGAPKAVRAVASACGANPLAVAIPCHRVLRSDGRPAGYRWGVHRKRTLLAREKRVAEQAPAPLA